MKLRKNAAKDSQNLLRNVYINDIWEKENISVYVIGFISLDGIHQKRLLKMSESPTLYLKWKILSTVNPFSAKSFWIPVYTFQELCTKVNIEQKHFQNYLHCVVADQFLQDYNNLQPQAHNYMQVS